MSKRLPIFFLICFVAATQAQAQDAASAMVEQPPTSAFRLTQRGFYDAYGFNDTARAVINLFYAKWGTGRKIMQYAGAPVPAASVLGKHYNLATNGVAPNYNSYYYDPWVAPMAYSLFATSAFGLGKATKWNRRQLYQAIRSYRATQRLPAFVTPKLLMPYLAREVGEAPSPIR